MHESDAAGDDFTIRDPSGAVVGTRGIEVGSLSSFFSSERDRRLAVAKLGSAACGVVQWNYEANAALANAELAIREIGRATNVGGERCLRVTARSNSLLMDAVLRFVFPLERVRRARIGERDVQHRSRNRYHQFAAQEVELEFGSVGRLRFTPLASVCPAAMAPVVYLRDEIGQWVLHFRLLTTRPEVVVFKGCHRWFNKPFPNWVQRPVTRWPLLLDRLLYVRERVSQRIPFQVNGAARLAGGEFVELAAGWQWL